MEREACARADVVTQCCALACLSYHHAAREDPEGALEAAERADELARCQQDALDDTDMAFVMYSLGKAIWMNGAEDLRQRKKGRPSSLAFIFFSFFQDNVRKTLSIIGLTVKL